MSGLRNTVILQHTLLQPLTMSLNQAALQSFVTAALALRDAFIAVGGDPADFTLKWPNDVLLKGGKVAGILLETMGKGPSHLCIGIGVNIVPCPKSNSSLEPTAVSPKSFVGGCRVRHFSAEGFPRCTRR